MKVSDKNVQYLQMLLNSFRIRGASENQDWN